MAPARRRRAFRSQLRLDIDQVFHLAERRLSPTTPANGHVLREAMRISLPYAVNDDHAAVDTQQARPAGQAELDR